MSASVNRDLKRRVRTINGIANHRPVVQNDIRQAARLVALYDNKFQLYVDPVEVKEGEEPKKPEPAKDLDALVGRSKNPVLDGVVEYFVEEHNAEEEELLGVNAQTSDNVKFPLEVDSKLCQYLDKLILYLRLVHSVDFYNQCEYSNEDLMPNRLGIVHVRDFPPTGEETGKSESGAALIPKKSSDDHISQTDEKLKTNILKYEIVSEEDEIRLGKKDPDQAVEDFIKENSQELSKDKWLCPLSGKKFKGPEFIRKHLYSKHEHKIQETKDTANYYNNYIADFDRPHNIEAKPPPTPTVEEVRRPVEDRFHNGKGNINRKFFINCTFFCHLQFNYFHLLLAGPPRHSWGPDRRFGGGNRFGGGPRGDFGARPRFVDDFGTGRGGGRDPRQPPNYRDLDAPDEVI